MLEGHVAPRPVCAGAGRCGAAIRRGLTIVLSLKRLFKSAAFNMLVRQYSSRADMNRSVGAATVEIYIRHASAVIYIRCLTDSRP